VRQLIVAIALVSVSFWFGTNATAEQRSRERCQAMADAKSMHASGGRWANERRKYIRRCMEGRLKKDRR
jgi:uncharacterized membrane protein